MEPAFKENFIESRCKVDEERIKRLKTQLMNTPQELDMERIEPMDDRRRRRPEEQE